MSDGPSSEGQNSWTPTQSGEWSQYRNNLMNQFNSGGFYDRNYAGGEDTFAGWSPDQQGQYDRLVGNQGAVDMSLDALESTLGPYDPNNQALTAAIDSAAGDVTRNLNENLMPSIGSEANMAGQVGSTRQGIAEGIAARGAGEQVQDIATNMRLNDMQTWQQNQQNALANFGNITQGISAPMGAEQSNRQGGLDDLFNRWDYESGIDRENLLQLRDMLNVDMGGTGTQEQESGGK